MLDDAQADTARCMAAEAGVRPAAPHNTWLIRVGSRRCSNGPRRWRRTSWIGSASALYERIRPEVPEGVAGWVARAALDLGRIRNAAV